MNDEETLTTNAGLTLDEGSSALITAALLETTDVDNTPAELVFTITSGPTYGTVLVGGTSATQFTQQQINDGLVSYQHDGGEILADSFDFTVDDGQGLASTGTFTITIRPFPGDYNNNETVDAADYVLWRKMLGTNGRAAVFRRGWRRRRVGRPGRLRRVAGPFRADAAGAGSGDGGSVEQRDSRTESRSGAGVTSRRTTLASPSFRYPSETISAPRRQMRPLHDSASFAVLETRSLWHDLSTRSRRTIHRYQVAESGGDDLPLLLAIDRVGRSPRQDSFVNDDSGNDEHRADDDDSESEIDEPLLWLRCMVRVAEQLQKASPSVRIDLRNSLTRDTRQQTTHLETVWLGVPKAPQRRVSDLR